MNEDKSPNASPGAPGEDPGDLGGGPGGDPGDGDDVLRRAARVIRAGGPLEAMVPLATAEREQIAEAAMARVLGATAAAPSVDAPVPVRVPGGAATGDDGAFARRLAQQRSRKRSIAIAATGAALAAAAVLAVFVAGRGGGGARAPLPVYAMAVAGEQAVRGAADAGAPGEPVRLRPETRLVIKLTAQAPERDALLRLVLVRAARATVLDPPVARDRSGTFTIEGAAGELLGAQSDGPAEIVAVLGRALPGDDEIGRLATGAATPPPALQVLRQAVVLEGFSHAAVDALLGGCGAVVELGARPRCEVAIGAPLRLWIGVAQGATLTLDGAQLEVPAVARGGGAAFALEARAGVLAVRVADREVAAWQIAAATTPELVRAADQALSEGKLDDAEAALAASAARTAPEDQLEVVRRRARIARRRGELDRERAYREQAVALARSLHRVSVEIDETIAMLNGLLKEHAIAAAVQLLPALEARGASYAEGVVDREFYRGLIASELGELGEALGAFRRALTVTERIGDAVGAALIRGSQADVLQSLGREREARALVEAEVERGSQDSDVCARVDALTTAGWLLRDADPPRAQQLADQAAVLSAGSCQHLVPITLVNRGWLLATAGRYRDARAVLDRLAAMPRERDGRVTTWMLRLEAEIVLGEDPARAEQQARRLAARAAELCSTELGYEAQLLRARALVALGRGADATAALAEADRALTLWSRLVPLGEGRETFFQRHDQLARIAIPHLRDQLARGRPGAARALAGTVRRSIARFVRSLEGSGRIHARAGRGDAGRDRTSKQFERTLERWPARLDARAAPAAGSALPGVCEARDAAALGDDAPGLDEAPSHAALFVHPTPDGLLVLAWRGDRAAGDPIAVHELARGNRDEATGELSARIARAAAPLLAGAPAVWLHVHRSLAALPLDHDLAAALGVPIAFAVDAPARPRAACPGPPRALFVTDPQRNLFAAGASARTAERAVARMGYAIDVLEGAAATRAAVEARLADPCLALFHYDGHAITGGQRDRTDDALALAGGDMLTAADVLALPRVPDAVVLNGCTTAAPEGLGLAQAFVLAGARQVIASLDAVRADDAARFTAALFDAPAPGLDLARSYAHVAAAADLPAARQFRVFAR